MSVFAEQSAAALGSAVELPSQGASTSNNTSRNQPMVSGMVGTAPRERKRSARSSLGKIPVPSSPTKRLPLQERPRTAQGITRARTPSPSRTTGRPSVPTTLMSPPREDAENVRPGSSMRRSRRSSGPLQSSLSHIPVAVVGAGRVLTSSGGSSPRTSLGGSPNFGKSPDMTSNPAFSPPMSENGFPVKASGLPRPPSPVKPSRHAAVSSNNPFYGGGGASADRHAARVSSAASGTGRVIDNLQGELASTRSALEEAKSQLRLSQRAIESLNRQLADLTDGKERSKVEYEALSIRYQRKERMLEDVLSRARSAEAELESEKDGRVQMTKRAKELETRTTEAEARAGFDRSRYEALQKGHAGLRDALKREAGGIKQELEACRTAHAAELDAAKAAQQDLLSRIQERDRAAAEAKAAVANLEAAQKSFIAEWSPQMAELADDIRRSTASTATALTEAEALQGDFARMRRQVREHAANAK